MAKLKSAGLSDEDRRELESQQEIASTLRERARQAILDMEDWTSKLPENKQIAVEQMLTEMRMGTWRLTESAFKTEEYSRSLVLLSWALVGLTAVLAALTTVLIIRVVP